MMNLSIDSMWCICGLPARGAFDELGAFCSSDCRRVGAYMYRERAKETAWLARQVGRTPGLHEALERVLPKRAVPVDARR